MRVRRQLHQHGMNDFAKLFAYDRWANSEVVRALSALSDPPERTVKLIAHIVGTQYVWWSRMTGEVSAVPVWPDWNVRQTQEAASEIGEKWREIALRGDEFQAGEFTYANTRGETWTSRNDDVMMHVVMHGAYHRGQIAAQIRACGHQPPYTDYVQATRAGLLA